MTRQQLKFLRAIDAHQKLTGRTPSYTEIAKLLGISSIGTVHKHIQNLVKAGVIERRFHEKQAIKILVQVEPEAHLCCPHCLKEFEIWANRKSTPKRMPEREVIEPAYDPEDGKRIERMFAAQDKPKRMVAI